MSIHSVGSLANLVHIIKSVKVYKIMSRERHLKRVKSPYFPFRGAERNKLGNYSTSYEEERNCRVMLRRHGKDARASLVLIAAISRMA